MNYYRCYIEVDGYRTCYSQDVSYIWAKDAEEARELYRKENNFRKNKKGLTVELAEYTRGIANKQTVNQVLTKNVWNSFLQMIEEIKYWGKVTNYYCPTCKNKVQRTTKCCKYCGTELIFRS